jgi:alginate O-acetyltransferase complex protein AlgI
LHPKRPHIHPGRLVSAAKMLLVFSVVTAAWLLFKFPNFSHAVQYVRAIGRNPWSTGFSPRVFTMLLLSLPVVLYHLAYLLRAVPDARDAGPDFPDAPASQWALWSHQLLSAPRVLWGHVTRWSDIGWVRPVAYGIMLFLILVNSSNAGEFIYFQF